MISYSKKLICRRELLIARSVAQRNALTREAQALLKKISIVDIGLTMLARLKKNPAWLTGLIVGLVVIKPRRLLSVLQTVMLAMAGFAAARTGDKKIS